MRLGALNGRGGGGDIDGGAGGMAFIVASGMVDCVEGSMDDSGVGDMTVVVFRDMDGSVDFVWTATAF